MATVSRKQDKTPYSKFELRARARPDGKYVVDLPSRGIKVVVESRSKARILESTERIIAGDQTASA